MPITMNSIFNKARALLDEYTEEGVLTPESDVIDMQTKAIVLADMAQKELYSVGKMEKTFSFNNKPTPNLLGNYSNFEIVDFVGTDQIYEAVGGKAYYFEATGAGVAYIEEYNGIAWVTLVTVSMPVGDDFVAYKGVTGVTDPTYPVRIRFTGSTFYRHTNRALFGYPFTAAQVPDFRPWVKIDMPADFMDISQLIVEYPDRQYAKDSLYKWEPPNMLYINYFFTGNYRMQYYPIPVTITAITDTLQCSEVIGQAIVYYIAARLAPFENPSLVNFFEAKYVEMKLSAGTPKPMSWETVKPVYTIGGVV